MKLRPSRPASASPVATANSDDDSRSVYEQTSLKHQESQHKNYAAIIPHLQPLLVGQQRDLYCR